MAAAAVTVKYMRRKVFAVRDFPVGCGHTALPVAGRKRPAEDSLAVPPPPPVAAAAATVPVLPLKEPKVEPVESGGVAKGTNLELPNGPKPPEVAPETSKGGLVAEPAFGKMVVQVNQKRCYPMFHPPPKRRKVSCVRDYPAGCGPNSPVLVRGEGLEVIAAADAPSASNVRDGEKLVVEGTIKVNSTERSKGAAKSNGAKHIGEKYMSKGVGVEKKQPQEPEGSIKVASTEKSQEEAMRKNGESIREKAREMSNDDQLKCAPKSRQVATSQTEGNSGLVVHGDRMVVQALVAASNCPWSQGRKPGGFSSHSVTPKSNVKKGRKSLSNTAVRGASIARHINIL